MMHPDPFFAAPVMDPRDPMPSDADALDAMARRLADVLTDNEGSPQEDAIFALYKDTRALAFAMRRRA